MLMTRQNTKMYNSLLWLILLGCKYRFVVSSLNESNRNVFDYV
ncbi:lipoprotein, putative [Staphylococcus pseudintermedius ED99]|nr:lipoprotein, putative [Staphylococcus pseudintermedius ED99]